MLPRGSTAELRPDIVRSKEEDCAEPANARSSRHTDSAMRTIFSDAFNFCWNALDCLIVDELFSPGLLA